MIIVDSIRNLINFLGNPVIYFSTFVVGWCALMKYADVWTQPKNAKRILYGSFAALFLAGLDPHFRNEAIKPDNVPIWLMLYALGIVIWVAFRRATVNDQLMAEGKPTLEKQESDKKVYTWPDLVYSELICMVVFTAFIIVWAIFCKAPLEEPANSGITPAVAKAPWYFLGLQEMLVYFDPWMAGVVLPSVILVGLMAVPYIDFNKAGNGYYTFNERKFAVSTFLFGFLPLWVAMIVLGTFLRGPNWNFFSPYEFWDVHKLELLNNINLSELFWIKGLGRPLPVVPPGATFAQQAPIILLREWLGLVGVAFYLVVLPNIMAATVFKKYYVKMGFLRYMVLANLMLMMMSLPIKMVLRWAVNLKYIVAIPEWFFNI